MKKQILIPALASLALLAAGCASQTASQPTKNDAMMQNEQDNNQMAPASATDSMMKDDKLMGSSTDSMMKDDKSENDKMISSSTPEGDMMEKDPGDSMMPK